MPADEEAEALFDVIVKDRSRGEKRGVNRNCSRLRRPLTSFARAFSLFDEIGQLSRQSRGGSGVKILPADGARIAFATRAMRRDELRFQVRDCPGFE